MKYLVLTIFLVGCSSSSSTGPRTANCWSVVDVPEMTIEFKVHDGVMYAEQNMFYMAECKVEVFPRETDSRIGDTLVLYFDGAKAYNKRRYSDFWGSFYSEVVAKPIKRWNEVDTLYLKTGRKILRIQNFQWVMNVSSDCCGCQ